MMPELSRTMGGHPSMVEPAVYAVLKRLPVDWSVTTLEDTAARAFFRVTRKKADGFGLHHGFVFVASVPAESIRLTFEWQEDDWQVLDFWKALLDELEQRGIIGEAALPRRPGRPTKDLDYKLRVWTEWEVEHKRGSKSKRTFCELEGISPRTLNNWRDELIEAGKLPRDRK